ncbi:ComC/BlpC family leader-containing pheromone/bacteriocin [Chitinophaga pendula]|uniref:ComC/BlpC family leader-containing pheromone/bacteriocin n=1 Tax=Chitinophaga TaxID=79328 RepID=UPI000BAFD330|nr:MULTISPECIES: ComC/BlpC family leader-containing pheromone/bacteriocin [Chitinophaga]ASZ12310.1 hypothetical protein CK934_15745 [Chitinophaga sp. MD30]UCJ10101.1 ComC/BlpC family leader-containing pheromone/bacteriocin [Chitinophaga pendula]
MKKTISQFEVISRHDLQQINGGGSRHALPACLAFCRRTEEGLNCGPTAYCECLNNVCYRR